jgi:hypothetical protein
MRNDLLSTQYAQIPSEGISRSGIVPAIVYI